MSGTDGGHETLPRGIVQIAQASNGTIDYLARYYDDKTVVLA